MGRDSVRYVLSYSESPHPKSETLRRRRCRGIACFGGSRREPMKRFPMLRAGLAVVVLMVEGSVAAQVVATPQVLTSAQEEEGDQPACLLPPHPPPSPPQEIS